jgi:hypothetical protein
MCRDILDTSMKGGFRYGDGALRGRRRALGGEEDQDSFAVELAKLVHMATRVIPSAQEVTPTFNRPGYSRPAGWQARSGARTRTGNTFIRSRTLP